MSDPCCGDVCRPEAAPTAGATPAGPTWLMWRLVGAGSAIGAGLVLDWWALTGVGLIAYLIAIALTVLEPARQSWRAVRDRRLDINLLMLIAMVGAAILGEWVEAAAVVWLFAVSHWLEGRSLQRSRQAIRSLMTLAPDTAVVRRDGRDQQVPVGEVAIGDRAIVLPGERVPVDGRVVGGVSLVDESSVTGESWPAEKVPGATVYAGTVNGTGALEIDVATVAADSTLARVIRLVEQAQRERAPIEQFVDRFARWYTPAVVLLALAVAVVPPLMLAGDFSTWAYRALALLVVACPCALVISTPVSVVSGLTAGARAGVLIKGGRYLEQLARVRAVAFDKTGTLTEGLLTVTDVRPVNGGSAEGVLAVAAALEARSEHPIGRAIVAHAHQAGVPVTPGSTFRALPGFGAEASVAELPVVIGSHRLFEERALCTPDLHDRIAEVEARGDNLVLVGRAGEAMGVIGLTDRMREDGQAVVAQLRREGVAHIAMLTGDAQVNATAVTAALGLDEAAVGLLPADKVAAIARLRAAHGPVVMVGDGVNDAPALAAADVGVAMGAAGTAVALETADVALMADDLGRLPFAIRLGRATLWNIRTNVALAIALKVGFVALAAAGLATLWMAVLADTGASLLVTANGLRLLRLRPDRSL